MATAWPEPWARCWAGQPRTEGTLTVDSPDLSTVVARHAQDGFEVDKQRRHICDLTHMARRRSVVLYSLRRIHRNPPTGGPGNFLELAVATAIAVFGPESGAAVTTVVGMPIEVPVMSSVCAVRTRTRHWLPATA